MTPKIFIDGEHGTTGLQIRARLQDRDDIEQLSVPESERRNQTLREEMLKEADIAILCLPDDAAREAVALGKDADTRFIDASTAHRTNPDWVFGFAELAHDHSATIAGAQFVSNPGCYSTGAIALLRPLRDAGLLDEDHPITINAVSGYTGGGKQLIAKMENQEGDDGISANHFAYALSLKHKHVPEIMAHGRLSRRPVFTPNVGRFAQGMLVHVPLHLDMLSGSPGLGEVHTALADHYTGQDIVTVIPLAESTAIERVDPEALNGTNNMELFVFGSSDGSQVNLMARLDNLGKGASGAAVQNLGLMIAS